VLRSEVRRTLNRRARPAAGLRLTNLYSSGVAMTPVESESIMAESSGEAEFWLRGFSKREPASLTAERVSKRFGPAHGSSSPSGSQ
jgi:hypothetical protein